MLGHSSRHGFYMIGMLIALVILCFLTLQYFEKDAKGVSTYKSSIDSANSAACLQNQRVFQGQLNAWSMANPGKPLSVETLENAIPPVPIMKCPGGGTITISESGEIYCSKHNPSPVATPTPTPPDTWNFTPAPTPEQTPAQ